MNTDPNVTQLRWDRADTVSYFYSTQTYMYLQPILSEVIDTEKDPNFNVTYEFIDSIYSSVVQVLQTAAACFAPARKKSFFYKFWWCQELVDLKDHAIVSHKLWKEAGYP